MPDLSWMRRIPRASIQLDWKQVASAMEGIPGRDDREAVAAFEDSFGRYVGTRHNVAVSSGKVALALILQGLGARPGDGIVLASYNVPEVLSVVAGLGLRPLLADIDEGTLNIDPAQVEKVTDDRTRFLLVTHLYGHPANVDALSDVARSKGLEIVEDCAQALGATWRGRRVGVFGRASLFSFGMMKNLNTVQGGMVCTDDEGLAGRIRSAVGKAGVMERAPVVSGLVKSMGLWAATRRPVFSLGVYPFIRAAEAFAPSLLYRATKFRPAEFETGSLDVGPITAMMNGMQAAMGICGLERIDVANTMRAHNAVRLAARLEHLEGLRCQKAIEEAGQTWLNFVVRVEDRLTLKRRLLATGVDTTMGFLVACNRMPSVRDTAGACPVSEELEDANLYLPVWPELKDPDIDYIGDAVEHSLAGG